MTKDLWLIGALYLHCACATIAPPTTTTQVATPKASEQDRVLGSVNGKPVTTADLEPAVASKVREIENEMAQRKFHLLWAGLEEAIDTRLLDAEAKQQNMTAEEFRRHEITDRAGVVDDEEVLAFYEMNKDLIGVPFDVAEPVLRQQLSQRREEKLEETLSGRLRQGADIRYNLEAPDLPRFDVDVGQAPLAGPTDAPVTLIEFSDFQCPYCAEARNVIAELREIYPDQLRVAYRDFPLSQHPRARAASEAAHCAADQEKFWPYHDLLFDNPNALEAGDLTRYADQVDLDQDLFKTCVESGKHEATVKTHEEAGREYGVSGTPAIFVNGIKLVGLLPIPLLRAIIDKEIAKVGGNS